MTFYSGLEHIVREDELLAPYTWFRTGGPAKYFAEPTNADELAELVKRCRQEKISVRLLGGGSNILVREQGTDDMVLHLSGPAFGEVTVKDGVLHAGGGAKLAHLISTAVREGLAGLEMLAGIPGTVGGALHCNSDNRGDDIGRWAKSANVLTRMGEVITRSNDDLRFAYRESSLDELVILDAQFELEQGDPQELTKRMQKLWIVQKAAQPISNQNSGLIFKDPGGISAASLIEQAGLKGTRVGGAEVSDRNANFIVADEGTPASDIIQLIDQLREGVDQQLGVELETALEIW